ncbi:MAG: hypothetical protein J6B29_05650 [Clostridia bacterium]|nr:hypothetical protein [Clostridia bacterium]
MAKYSMEDLFKVACAEYAGCKEIVGEITSAVQAIQPSITIETTMTAFDMVLQSILLSVATIDSKMYAEEKHFINLLTEYGDILALVNSEFTKEYKEESNITWDDVADFDNETRAKVAVISAALVDPYATSMVNIFATVDKAIEERDYIAMLREKVLTIIMALSGIDGDDLESQTSEAEYAIGVKVFDRLVYEKWKNITG